jgi:hypothetical protein
MRTSFHVAALSGDEAPLALPLIQATWRDTDLASWRSFVASFNDGTAASGSGVLALRDSAEAICGIIAFRIDRDLRVGPVLAVHMFTAVDLANSTRPVRALLDTVDAQARERGCAGIQIRLSNMQPHLAAQLSALGLSSEAGLFSKRVDASPARH